MKNSIKEQIAASIRVKQAILKSPAFLDDIQAAAGRVVAAFRAGHKLLLAGNGGSAADAQHIAGEMVNRFRFDRPPLPAIALSTDTSVLTAIGNDADFRDIFARQVQALGRAGDVFIGISTSGHSPNIVKAFQECRRRRIVRIGLTGRGGGVLKAHCDLCLQVPSAETPRVQEAHILIAHILCGIIEESLFGKG